MEKAADAPWSEADGFGGGAGSRTLAATLVSATAARAGHGGLNHDCLRATPAFRDDDDCRAARGAARHAYQFRNDRHRLRWGTLHRNYTAGVPEHQPGHASTAGQLSGKDTAR